MIKKIFKIAVVVIVIAIGVKMLTGKSVGKHYMETVTEKIEANKEAKIGETIICPICGKSFEKKFLGGNFCSDECKAKYEKMVEVVEKEGRITDGAISVISDTKKSIEKNIK